MNRLQSELNRLYHAQAQEHANAAVEPALSGTGDTVRAMVLEITQPAGWAQLSSVWRGVQADLALPANNDLLAWQRAGWVDGVRHFVPADEKLYSWWSYRNRDWRSSDRGRRLDHVWVTDDLAGGLARQTILKDARDWAQASDHVPVCVELAL